MRRARVIEICEEEKTRAEERLKGVRKEGDTAHHADALLHSLMSSGTGAGNVVIRVFDIIKKAAGNGASSQRGIAGVYQDDDNSKPIIRWPEIRTEAHKIATRINRANTLDITTVREVLEWVGIGGGKWTETNRTEEIDRICSKENGMKAMGKFQQHKGLGTDGFDGYLIKNATQEVQDIYHQVTVSDSDKRHTSRRRLPDGMERIDSSADDETRGRLLPTKQKEGHMAAMPQRQYATKRSKTLQALLKDLD
eukprot:6194971-Pleurochrysis_carterae.AAC.1